MGFSTRFLLWCLALWCMAGAQAQAMPPLAFDGQFNVRFNTRTDLGLVGRNPNADADLRVYFEPVTPPAHGSVVFGEYNFVSYTPHAGYAGPDSFTFRVRHAVWGYSNIATASITVAAAVLPVTQPGSTYTPHGTPASIALLAQDANAGGPFALAYAVATPPAHGTVTINDSTATYTPASGFWGADSFAFTATSANGTSAPASVRVLVGQPLVLGVGGALGDTGQTQCTDSAGMATSCTALTSHPGQDGRFGRDAQAGSPAFDYLPLAGGCVQDRVTGLVWSTETLNMPWAAAAPAYSRCGIASGWRLPTRRELLSIVHHGAASPAIDRMAFPGTQSTPYWSSDAAAANAWAVHFNDGDTRLLPTTETHAARLVARPVNQAPTLTLGAAEIVVPNDQRPGPRSYPGWATGISPGPAREAGQQLIAHVRLLPVPGSKTLEFDVPPAIDPATGDLTFTVQHRLTPSTLCAGGLGDMYPDGTCDWWASSAGRVRVEVTLQDDGGTAGGGADSTTQSFEIAVSPVPTAIDINIKHPWKAACIPITLLALDIDTDPAVSVLYPQRYWPIVRIKEYPREGFLDQYGVAGTKGAVASRAKSISVPGGTYDPDDSFMLANYGTATDSNSQRGSFGVTWCYKPISSTYVGPDTFSYAVIDVDGNESAPASVAIEIYEVK